MYIERMYSGFLMAHDFFTCLLALSLVLFDTCYIFCSPYPSCLKLGVVDFLALVEGESWSSGCNRHPVCLMDIRSFAFSSESLSNWNRGRRHFD